MTDPDQPILPRSFADMSVEFDLSDQRSEAIGEMIASAHRAESRRGEVIAAVAVVFGCGYAVIQQEWHTDYVLLPRHATIERFIFPNWDSFDNWRVRQGWAQ